MNIIKLKVNFEKRTVIKEGVVLTENDFNSTKIEFEFDREDGRKVFEMNNPNGELVYSDTIVNNELVLVGKDKNNNLCSLFTIPGTYPFEISLYDGDSKLSSASDGLYVAPEAVKISDEVAEPYLPVFDEMNATLSELIDEANNLNIEAEKVDTTTTITITKKDGTTEEVDIEDGVAGQDGRDGLDGADAKINGVNTLTLEAGDNITLDQEGSTLTISATGGGSGGTSDYTDLSNKPKINNVELNGNKTTSDLNISYNDLTNKPTIPTVPTNVSAFTNDAGYTTNTGTITSVKMNGTTISSSGEADLGTVITDISSKQDTLVSGTNIKTINNTTLLGSGNFDIDGVKDAKTTNLDKFWSGTLSEYNAIQNKDNDTFYNITDDYSNNGLPSSGTTGQVLAKASNSDYDTEWISQHSFSHETWTFTLEDDSTVDKEVVLW